jgi:hypothetical protein
MDYMETLIPAAKCMLKEFRNQSKFYLWGAVTAHTSIAFTGARYSSERKENELHKYININGKKKLNERINK